MSADDAGTVDAAGASGVEEVSRTAGVSGAAGLSDARDGLRAREVGFHYGRRCVLSGVNLDLGAGEVVALLGRNGAGKSTLLRILLGLLRPGQGRIELGGRPIGDYSRRELATRLAYVPQAHATPFPYTVLDIVLMGRVAANGFLGAPRAADRAAAEALLARFGVAHLAGRRYTEISGGERQLALLARALIQQATILVMDEPMAGLDFGRQLQLLQYLRDLAADGHAVLMTTHHPEHLHWAATRVAVLIDGRIAADGPPEDIVTAAMLHRLYGVDVVATRSTTGQVVFQPVGARQQAPTGPPADQSLS